MLALFGRIPVKVLIAIAAALLVVIILSLTYCSGKDAGEDKVNAANAEADKKLDTEVRGADEAAAAKRVLDSINAAQQRKELEDAQNEPDPDKRRTARGCLILRQQGVDTAKVPACN